MAIAMAAGSSGEGIETGHSNAGDPVLGPGETKRHNPKKKQVKQTIFTTSPHPQIFPKANLEINSSISMAGRVS
jgi:hypothetical protein